METKNMPIFKMPCLIIFTIFISLLAHSVFAETKTFIKEYTYRAGDEDSRNSSRTIALREVKRLLLEELGTYLESQTEVKNFQMTKDQIYTLTAGIVSAEVIEDTWDGKTYWLKAKITANQQDVIKSIDSLRRDPEKVKELVDLRKMSDELLRENERLNKELKIAKGGKQQEAAQAYKRNIDNLNATEWFERGSELFLSSNFTDAAKAYGKAIELNPQDAEAYVKRGIMYLILNNYQQALADLNKAIELNSPDYNIALAYSFRGDIYNKLGNHQQEIRDYSKAIELDPENQAAYRDRGYAHVELGNYQQALIDYNKAIELNPKDVAAYGNRAVAYDIIGNYKQEILDYNKAIELDPMFSWGYYYRGIAYVKIGNCKQANEDIKTAARLGLGRAQDFLRSKGIGW